MMAGLRLLRAVLGSPGNPFVSDWVVVNDYAPRLFLQFARLFHDLPRSKRPITALCKAHLQVLSFIPARATPALSAWPSYCSSTNQTKPSQFSKMCSSAEVLP